MSTGLTSSLLFQGAGVIQFPRLPAFLISSAGLKTSPGLTCGLHFYRKGKNVHWTFLLLHKAVEDFFNHVPFVI